MLKLISAILLFIVCVFPVSHPTASLFLSSYGLLQYPFFKILYCYILRLFECTTLYSF